MSSNHSGRCRCGQVEVTLNLPRSITELIPRACDCDFCTSRQVSYLSDPKGRLNVDSKDALVREYQGSESATFHSCASCGDLVMVTCAFEHQLKGALNASILDCFSDLAKPLSVSPKQLQIKEKLSRWESNWMLVEYGQG